MNRVRLSAMLCFMAVEIGFARSGKCHHKASRRARWTLWTDIPCQHTAFPTVLCGGAERLWSQPQAVPVIRCSGGEVEAALEAGSTR